MHELDFSQHFSLLILLSILCHLVITHRLKVSIGQTVLNYQFNSVTVAGNIVKGK